MEVLHTMTLATFGFSTVYALPVLLVLLVIEEAGIPIPVPGDTLLMVAGAVAIDQPWWFAPLVVAIGASAAIAGSSILYFFMHHGGRTFIERHGRLIFLGPKRMARVERWFARHHRHALLLGRLIPGLRIPTTALAGLSGLPYRQYLRAAFVAALVWSATFFLLGVLVRLTGLSLLGHLRSIIAAVPAPLLAVFVVVLVADGLLAWWMIVRRRRSGDAAWDEAASPSPRGGAEPTGPMDPRGRRAPVRDAENGAATSKFRHRDRELVD